MMHRHSRARDKTVVSVLCRLTAAVIAAKYCNLFFLSVKNMEKAHLSNSQPVSEVSGVGQGRGEAHHSDTLGGVGGDEVGSGHDDLQHWTPVLTWEAQQGHIL